MSEQSVEKDRSISTDAGTKATGKDSGKDAFSRFAAGASNWLGSKWAFLFAFLAVIAWIVSGPLFHFSNTWQLVINTGTTIITFLMVFLIQNTQNRDAKAINLKLDELIKATGDAEDHMVDIESLSDDELDAMQKRYEQVREECLARKKRSGV